MAKFIFKDTGEEIKVGDTVYYLGYYTVYSNGTRKALETIKSCEVKTISNFYINRNLENDSWDNKHNIMITTDRQKETDDKIETFVIGDNLFSSEDALKNALIVRQYQKSISEVIFSINDLDKIKKIINLINL